MGGCTASSQERVLLSLSLLPASRGWLPSSPATIPSKNQRTKPQIASCTPGIGSKLLALCDGPSVACLCPCPLSDATSLPSSHPGPAGSLLSTPLSLPRGPGTGPSFPSGMRSVTMCRAPPCHPRSSSNSTFPHTLSAIVPNPLGRCAVQSGGQRWPQGPLKWSTSKSGPTIRVK